MPCREKAGQPECGALREASSRQTQRRPRRFPSATELHRYPRLAPNARSAVQRASMPISAQARAAGAAAGFKACLEQGAAPRGAGGTQQQEACGEQQGA